MEERKKPSQRGRNSQDIISDFYDSLVKGKEHILKIKLSHFTPPKEVLHVETRDPLKIHAYPLLGQLDMRYNSPYHITILDSISLLWLTIMKGDIQAHFEIYMTLSIGIL